MNWSSLICIDQFWRLVSANSLTVMPSFLRLSGLSAGFSWRVGGGAPQPSLSAPVDQMCEWVAFAPRSSPQRQIRYDWDCHGLKCPTFHSYFGWIFVALVDLYYFQWVTLTTWLSALSRCWARRGLWIWCPTMPSLKCTVRSCGPQFLCVGRYLMSLSDCRRPSTFSANILIQRVDLTLCSLFKFT